MPTQVFGRIQYIMKGLYGESDMPQFSGCSRRNHGRDEDGLIKPPFTRLDSKSLQRLSNCSDFLDVGELTAYL